MHFANQADHYRPDCVTVNTFCKRFWPSAPPVCPSRPRIIDPALSASTLKGSFIFQPRLSASKSRPNTPPWGRYSGVAQQQRKPLFQAIQAEVATAAQRNPGVQAVFGLTLLQTRHFVSR